MLSVFQNIKQKRLVASLLLSGALAACNNQQQAQNDLNDLKQYVQQSKDSVHQYADVAWDTLNNKFEDMRQKAAKDSADMSQDMKADYYTAVNDWQNYRDTYKHEKIEKEKTAEMDSLRKTLVIDGVRADYTDLKGADVKNEYSHFVAVVEMNKDNYTKDQWQVINVNWQALNGRKRELEKDIPSGDKGEIIKLQAKFVTIKALNRPEASNS